VLDLRSKAEAELLKDILPFWLSHAVDDEYGGFRGQITNDLTIDSQGAKGVILNARVQRLRQPCLSRSGSTRL